MEKFTSVSSFIHWVQVQKRFSKKVSLDKMRFFCQTLGNPQNQFKSIHITGTNGKGSTVAMLTTILMNHGYHVGMYTSPYIQSFNERISYDFKPIDDASLLYFANQIIEKYDFFKEKGYEMPTFFEFITLLAFLYFANQKEMDYAIIEVGMGGRLDSTNVITPILSIVTNVALDHMAILGNTKEAILTEKLGIVKPTIPVVAGLKEDTLKQIATSRAKDSASCLSLVDYSSLKIKKCDLTGSLFDYKKYHDVKLSLLGFHQIENALVVLEAFEVLKEPLKLEYDKLLYSFANVSWIGRLEMVNEHPYVMMDGSHNIDGITRVCEFIRSLQLKNKRAVVSISHDKELQSMIDVLDKTFEEIVFTKYTYARSADAEELASLSKCKRKKVISDIDESILYVKKNPVDLTIFMGSLYLVSEVRSKLK